MSDVTDDMVTILLRETETYLSNTSSPSYQKDFSYVRRPEPTVNYVPGPIPDGATLMILAWPGRDDVLVAQLCSMFKINEQTARLWMFTERKRAT